jgi:hypothetical protein
MMVMTTVGKGNDDKEAAGFAQKYCIPAAATRHASVCNVVPFADSVPTGGLAATDEDANDNVGEFNEGDMIYKEGEIE